MLRKDWPRIMKWICGNPKTFLYIHGVHIFLHPTSQIGVLQCHPWVWAGQKLEFGEHVNGETSSVPFGFNKNQQNEVFSKLLIEVCESTLRVPKVLALIWIRCIRFHMNFAKVGFEVQRSCGRNWRRSYSRECTVRRRRCQIPQERPFQSYRRPSRSAGNLWTTWIRYLTCRWIQNW